jgi:hypothetical protein
MAQSRFDRLVDSHQDALHRATEKLAAAKAQGVHEISIKLEALWRLLLSDVTSEADIVRYAEFGELEFGLLKSIRRDAANLAGGGAVMRITFGEATRVIPLPFIRTGKKGKRGRIEIIECYRDVKVTGNFAADHVTAQTYALNYMEYEHRALTIHAPRIPLVNIIADMVKQGVDIKNDPIASSFLYLINNVSMDLWTPAVIGHARKWYDHEHKFLVEHCARLDAERSERARKAAFAGAAKRRKAKSKAKRVVS